MTPATTGNEGLIGQRLGRYLISSSLGRGGMAEVFRARDERLSREVAIKVVLPAYGSEPQLLQRFLREARVVASLEHPNILPIYDFGEREGLPYLVMPLVRGGTLADRLDGSVLDPARIATWARDLALALDAAHAAGVLHRDVKPGNVLVGRDQHLFLADFGIARLCDATRLTRTGTVVGTPVYMAPEVAAGQPAAAASDLYSLAVMCYEMLAGRPPFEGENVLSILHQHATSPVPPIAARLEQPGSGVDRVLTLGLAKRPGERPPSCRAFAEMLAEQLPGFGAATPPAGGHLPTLEMTREPTVAPALSAAASSVPMAPMAPMTPPTSDAYATVRAPAGSFLRLRRWGLAGLLGGVVAVVGFLALKGAEQQPAVTADAVEHGGASAPAAVGGIRPPAAGEARSVQSSAPIPTQMPSAAPTPPVSPPASPPTAASPPLVEADSPASSVEAPAIRPSSTATLAAGPGGLRPGTLPAPGRSDAASPDRMRFHALRSFASRSTEDDFRKAQEAARRRSDGGPGTGSGTAMAAYARGGLAYLAGDDAGAGAALRAALGDQRFVAHWSPSPLMLLAASGSRRGEFEPWELALGYGDPRAVAGDVLDDLLGRHPENPRLRFARALIHRLDAEHREVIRYGVPVFQQLDDGDAPEARGYLAQVIGDAYLGLDRSEEALEWFRRAFEGGGQFRGIAAMRAAETARAMRRPDVMAEFLRRGCEAGLQPACRRLQSSPRLSRDRR